MRNQRRSVCLLFVFSVLFSLGSLGQTQDLTRRPAASQSQKTNDLDLCLLVELDRFVQARFKEIDRGFGYRRVVTLNDTPHRFKPENAKEADVVSDLEQARLRVALYLAGRGVIGARPEAAQWERYVKKPIQGPAFVTAAGQSSNDLPAPAELWEHSQKAMEVFTDSDEYNFDVGKWKFTARPVRAAEQSCLECHARYAASPLLLLSSEGQAAASGLKPKPLRVGDPLGVILYAYERARE
jgi:hypothetical protein